MASSRLEKIGTIYSRTKGLIQAGALKWEDRPLWYDLYESFPPKEEPRFDRPTPNVPVRAIFYREDKIRAAFQNRNRNVGTVNLLNNRTKSLSQRFIETYETLEKQYGSEAREDQLYQESIEMLKRDQDVKRDLVEEEEPISFTAAFKQARDRSKDSNSNVSVNVKDIFKE